MSRIKVLPLQKDISVSISSPNIIVVRGKLGIIKKKINSVVLISLNHENIFITFSSKSRNARTQSGTVVSILSNMFTGVSVGFEKKFCLVGVGYRASIQDGKLVLHLGFSHPVYCNIPNNIIIELPSSTEIILRSFDKELLGQFSSDIRSYKRPEPYKGKGIRYAGEVIIVKESKKK